MVTSNPFGISDAWSFDPYRESRELELLSASGAGMVRLPFGWPLGAGPELDRLESQVDIFRSRGIEVLGLVGGIDLQKNPKVPTDIQAANAIKLLVRRFKARIHHWEFWHQPDDSSFWPADELVSYAQCLKTVYARAKDGDPSTIVHLGGLSARLPKSLQCIYQLGAGACFDVVNIQPFLNPLMPDAVGGLQYFYEMVRKTMVAGGDSEKPVWFSHLACPGLREPRSTADWFLGKNPSELHQAEWVRVLYEKALRWKGVEKIFWGQWKDTPRRCNDGSDFYGLLRADGTAKPSFEIYSSLANAFKIPVISK